MVTADAEEGELPKDLASPLFDDKEKGLTKHHNKLVDYQKSSFIHTIEASYGESE